MTGDNPNQSYTSVKKSYASTAYGSKTFTPTQLKMPLYSKDFLAICYAFKEFGRIFLGTPKTNIFLTYNESVTGFSRPKYYHRRSGMLATM